MSTEYTTGMVTGPVTRAEKAEAEVDRLRAVIAQVCLVTGSLNPGDPKKICEEVHKFAERALS